MCQALKHTCSLLSHTHTRFVGETIPTSVEFSCLWIYTMTLTVAARGKLFMWVCLYKFCLETNVYGIEVEDYCLYLLALPGVLRWGNWYHNGIFPFTDCICIEWCKMISLQMMEGGPCLWLSIYLCIPLYWVFFVFKCVLTHLISMKSVKHCCTRDVPRLSACRLLVCKVCTFMYYYLMLVTVTRQLFNFC